MQIKCYRLVGLACFVSVTLFAIPQAVPVGLPGWILNPPTVPIAAVSYGNNKTLTVPFAENNNFDLIGIYPDQALQIKLKFPEENAGQIIFVALPDGGTITTTTVAGALVVSLDGTVTFEASIQSRHWGLSQPREKFDNKRASYSQAVKPTWDKSGTIHWTVENGVFHKSQIIQTSKKEAIGGKTAMFHYEERETAYGAAGGHVHMDVTGRGTRDFSETDGIAARKRIIVGKATESDLKTNPTKVTRLTPQTDGTEPQVRTIKPPTKEEMRKYGIDPTQLGTGPLQSGSGAVNPTSIEPAPVGPIFAGQTASDSRYKNSATP